jgi:membrane-associated phospholipid phosphatase
VAKLSAPAPIGEVAARVTDDAHALAAWWRGTYALLVATAVAFAALAFAAHHIPYFGIDLELTRAVQSVKNPTLDFIATWIGWPGFPPQSNVVFGGLVLVLAIRGKWLAAVGELLAAAGSAVLWFGIAPLVDRPRPSPELVHVSIEIPYGSFPSGHLLNLTAGLGFAWYMVYTLMPPSMLRTAVLWLVPIYLLLLGLARIYEGHHWPSDVLGGVLLGALWLWLSITTYRWLEKLRGATRDHRG